MKEIEIVEFEDYTTGTLDDYYEELEKEANKAKLPDYITDRQGILNLLKSVYKVALIEDPMYAQEVAIDNRNIEEGIYAVNPDNVTLFIKITEDERREFEKKGVPDMPGRVHGDS